MTSAHRPTFDPARGKEAARGPAYHQRLLPAHMTLKSRQPSQIADPTRDLRAELLKAEAATRSGKNGDAAHSAGALSAKSDDKDDSESDGDKRVTVPSKRKLEDDGDGDEETKRRRAVLQESRDMDADSVASSSDDDSDSDSGAKSKKDKGKARAKDSDEEDEEKSDSEDDDDSDDEESDDEMAHLQLELERIKRERAAAKAADEAEKAAADQEQREYDIAKGNPLLNPQDFNVKRRWDDDVVFKNQARGTEDKNKSKEFVNDLLRSDFHKRFMNKYVR
jgi:protein CWC15